MKAVLIGGGKIGRGFIGQVLYEAGYSLTFVDVFEPLVKQFKKYKEYPVYILGAAEEKIVIKDVDAHLINSDDALEALVDANIVTTAVGASVLVKTADYIAKAIKKRYEKKSQKLLTVIACENMENGTTVLFNAVKPLLTTEEMSYCEEYISFPDAEVSRMSIPTDNEKDNPLAVKVEQYMEWVVDKNNTKDDLTAIKNLELSDKPTAYIKRKIYTLTGHAMLAYLGAERGYTNIFESAFDKEIFAIVYKALKECGKAWSKEYDMNLEDFDLYITIMMRRFSDTRLQDPVLRVANQPIRKLGINERFIEPALTCEKHGIDCEYIIKGIVSALNFCVKEDEQSVKLQEMLKNEGIEKTLQKVCNLEKTNPLFSKIKTAYEGR